MRVNYTEANELYGLIDEYYSPKSENGQKLLDKLAKAINLIDECEPDASAIYIDENKHTVTAKLEFYDEWPQFLIDEIHKGYVEIKKCNGNFIKVLL